MTASLYYAIGTMSGTSMDGIDVALVQTDGEFFIQPVTQHSLAYSLEFHQQLKILEFAVRQTAKQITQQIITPDILLAATEQHFIECAQAYLQHYQQSLTVWPMQTIIEYSTELHCQAIKALIEKTNLMTDAPMVIGYHGQTLYHNPLRKITLQIGMPELLAEKLQLPVVAEFRQNDILHGGQGAPFAPLLHRALVLRDQLPLPTAIINCGGIANVTVISGMELTDVIGFDTGPGNVLLDQFVREKTNFTETMDVDGRYALNGEINQEILTALFAEACLKENFYTKPYPKSLDTSDFHLIKALQNCSINDGCATLAAWTAQTIVTGLKQLPTQPKVMILAGGGWKHPVISQEFIKAWPLNTLIKTADEIDWSSAALEAQIFAYLAVRSLLAKPLTLPTTTGVHKPLVGGKLYTQNTHHT